MDILAVLLAAAIQLTGLNAAPQFEEMTGDQLKQEWCVNPDCPALVSIHPPKTDRIIVNTDFDLQHDLSAQSQVVHVLAMYLMETNGGFSPDTSCDRVIQFDAQAHLISLAYLERMSQEYAKAGVEFPQTAPPQVVTFCTPKVKGEL